MNLVVETILKRYTLRNSDDYLSALREIIQQLALLSLWRSHFYEHAAFYGGSALRIFHGLPRFSEDLDFSLLSTDSGFSLEPYLHAIEQELMANGFSIEANRKKKSPQRRIESAFLKANTVQTFLCIHAPEQIIRRMHRNQAIKIAIEVDVDPPPYAQYEYREMVAPMPFQVRLYAPEHMFAGKMHAVLCRQWRERVKGRDLFDFVWFIGLKIPCDLKHLKARMVQSGHWHQEDSLGRNALLNLLRERFASIDLEAAASEVRPFLTDSRAVELWSRDFFMRLAGQIETVD